MGLHIFFILDRFEISLECVLHCHGGVEVESTCSAIGGPDKVVALIEKVPAPISAALKVVSGMLPAVGIGILLRYMNAKENVSWVILGFAVAT